MQQDDKQHAVFTPEDVEVSLKRATLSGIFQDDQVPLPP